MGKEGSISPEPPKQHTGDAIKSMYKLVLHKFVLHKFVLHKFVY